MKKTRILIADDHSLMRVGLSFLINNKLLNPILSPKDKSDKLERGAV